MKSHVALVIKNDSGEILFVQRSMNKKTLPGIWAFPSGTVEEGESIYETAGREAFEELGVRVDSEKLFASCELSEFSVKLQFVLCNIKSGKPFIKELDEIDKIEWMTFHDFFKRFSDEEIGHGLIWLRKHPEIWEAGLIKSDK